MNEEKLTYEQLEIEMLRVEKLYTKKEIKHYTNNILNPNNADWSYREYSPDIRRYLACNYLKMHNT